MSTLSWQQKLVERFKRDVTEIAEGRDEGPKGPLRDLQREIADDAELSAIRRIDHRLPNGATARTFASPSTPRGAFVWIHGGAFVGGNLDSAETVWPATLLAASGFDVLTLSYRKALNGASRRAIEADVATGWEWALTERDSWTTFPGAFSLGGASAGAHLAASIVQHHVDQPPARLVLVYPTLHSRLPALQTHLQAVMETVPHDRRFPAELVDAMNTNFSPGLPAEPFPGDDGVGHYPPTLVLNSDRDDLRSSGEAFASKLALNGREVTCMLEPGTFHGHLNEPADPASRSSVARIVNWLAAGAHLVQAPRQSSAS